MFQAGIVESWSALLLHELVTRWGELGLAGGSFDGLDRPETVDFADSLTLLTPRPLGVPINPEGGWLDPLSCGLITDPLFLPIARANFPG
jgi:hypothetical protein